MSPKSREHNFHAVGDTAAGSIDYEVIAIPIMIFAFDHAPPIWKKKSGHFAYAGFDSAAMFISIRANNFDFHDLRISLKADISPTISRQRPVIHTIGDDVEANPEIVFCQGMCREVTCVIDLAILCNCRILDRLLDRVDPQPDSADFLR